MVFDLRLSFESSVGGFDGLKTETDVAVAFVLKAFFFGNRGESNGVIAGGSADGCDVVAILFVKPFTNIAEQVVESMAIGSAAADRLDLTLAVLTIDGLGGHFTGCHTAERGQICHSSG